MVQWNRKSKRKFTGGLLKKHRKKKKYEKGRDFLPTRIDDYKVKMSRARGGKKKIIALSSNTANVVVGGKYKQAKIISVEENPADSHFVRRNIITKGALIQTDLGKAVVTSRPGQTGVINAKLIEANVKDKEA